MLSVIANKQKSITVVQGRYTGWGLVRQIQIVTIKNKRLIVSVTCSARFDIHPGREGFVDFKSGQESTVYRAKNGHLMVVSTDFSHSFVISLLVQRLDQSLNFLLQESTKSKTR